MSVKTGTPVVINMSDKLQTAILAAKAGAQEALKYFNKNPQITIKPDNTPVTEGDENSEAAIIKTIKEKFPDAKFLGEESGGDKNEKELWVIDPIDGTKNFIRGLPFWGILIAYVVDNKPVIGVSYLPIFDELLAAEVGFGTTRNGEKIHVSGINAVKDAYINHGTLSTKYYDGNLQNMIDLCALAFHERGFGDCYGYNLVARGKADIMFDAQNGPWDIAPFKVIIEEAGGKLTNFAGKEWTLADPDALATNGLLHDEVVALVNKKN